MGARTRIEDAWAQHLWIDHVAAVAVVATHILVIRLTGSGDWLQWIDSSQRTDLYAAAAGVMSAIGGLSAIAISIYTAANAERLRTVRRQHQGQLRRSWRSLLQGTAWCCLALLAALSLDREHDPLSVRFLSEYALTFAALRYPRLIWLFDRMMQVSDMDLPEPERAPAPVRDPNWVRRRQGTQP
ncbi:hypothetical protein SAMN06272781_0009 [Streptomyces sp. 1222.2]|uniref:hypothetical protein n=1 Tax=Streptomyces sp. 1222.2 TaxID=1938833 RepID=UPI000BC899FC|nr:hypothetical protein [Streptomyces sp. 1222.2]SOD65143.1 hypothetical protein SAMN06272781_0009 [Streptomyces sp. 1222.2]